MLTIEERLMKKVKKNPVTGCWEWQGAVSVTGFGDIYTGERVEKVHRVSYKLFVGLIEQGMQVHQICRLRHCLNPKHLILGFTNKIKSIKTLKKRLLSNIKINVKNGCWEWQGYRTPEGYGTVGFAGKDIFAHRAAYKSFFGGLKDSDLVCHSCDNPSCINPRHLWVGTHNDNMQDKVTKGRQAKGEQLSSAGLTEEDVRVIRLSVEFSRVLAKRYRVTAHTIGHIKSRKTWKYVACIKRTSYKEVV